MNNESCQSVGSRETMSKDENQSLTSYSSEYRDHHEEEEKRSYSDNGNTSSRRMGARKTSSRRILGGLRRNRQNSNRGNKDGAAQGGKGVLGKVNKFLEQNKETLDGPEGDNNLGFYRTLGSGDDDSHGCVSMEDEVTGDTNTVAYWKKQAQYYKSEMLERERDLKELKAYYERKLEDYGHQESKEETKEMKEPVDLLDENDTTTKENDLIDLDTNGTEDDLIGFLQGTESMPNAITVTALPNFFDCDEIKPLQEQKRDQGLSKSHSLYNFDPMLQPSSSISKPNLDKSRSMSNIKTTVNSMPTSPPLLQFDPLVAGNVSVLPQESAIIAAPILSSSHDKLQNDGNSALFPPSSSNINNSIILPKTENESQPQQHISTDGNFLPSPSSLCCPLANLTKYSSLTADQVTRYSRQLLVQGGFGVEGQHKLMKSNVLVVGAGGIGSTALLYLAAAGVNLTIVDHDTVETSNLHRQVIHTHCRNDNDDASTTTPINKAISARQTLLALNPTISIKTVTTPLTHENALDLCRDADCVLDASDNPRTRYFINDACVMSDKVLVSGSAMGGEGQLTVYNGGREGEGGAATGGCYRCLYPNGDKAEGCKSCADNGVLGPVPGLIGILGAMEVLKVLTGVGSTMHDRLLMYDALNCTFLNIKKPKPRSNCKVCSTNPSLTSMEDSYTASESCRGPSSLTSHPSLSSNDKDAVPNISPSQYNTLRQQGTPHVLLDVRVPQQFGICALDNSVNIPLDELKDRIGDVREMLKQCHGSKDNEEDAVNETVYCLCRRGVASAQATKVLIEEGIKGVDIEGGLDAWVTDVDKSFPMY